MALGPVAAVWERRTPHPTPSIRRVADTPGAQ